jgi:F0F1-type ATP synthase assembly protein I
VLTIGLFTWWEISISWNIVFLIVAGLYLYGSSRPKRKEVSSEETKQKINDERSVRAPAERIQLKAKVVRIAKDFIFVWILMGLLVFYIFSVQLGTGVLPQIVFASGNIVVEALLVFYLLRNRDKTKRSQQ